MENVKQLYHLEEAIRVKVQKSASPRTDIMKKIDCRSLAFKLLKTLEEDIIDKTKWENGEAVPLTATACKIGKRVLQEFETETKDTFEVNKSRLKAGNLLLTALGDIGIIDIQTRKFDVTTYKKTANKRTGKVSVSSKVVKDSKVMIIVNDFESLVRLTLLLPVNSDKTPVSSRPTFRKPAPYTKFNHPVIGAMFGKATRRQRRMTTHANAHRVFRLVNKQMHVGYEANSPLLDVYNTLKDKGHPLFTFEGKGFKGDKLASKLKESDNVLRVGTQIRDEQVIRGGAPFYEFKKLDFRQRLYTTNLWFKHDGCKLARSLFLLHDKESIGREGFMWMLIHAANVYGEDKRTLKGRMRFALRNLETWLKWAKNPIEYVAEWSSVDSPFEFMAVIMELNNAVNEDGSVNYDYESGLPIALDASCSGLMIFALLSKCKLSGKLTNMIKSIERGDAYAEVGNTISSEISKLKGLKTSYTRTLARINKLDKKLIDAKESGNVKLELEAQELRAEYFNENKDQIREGFNYLFNDLDAKTWRKLSKRPVMTYFYSCGPEEMAQALYSDFKDENILEKGELTLMHCEILAREFFKVLKRVFKLPSKLMSAIQKRASNLVKEQKENYSFISPFTGFYCEQDYKEDKTKQVRLFWDGRIYEPRVIARRKHFIKIESAITGASPNTIHCLDAALLSYIILTSKFDVFAIHDSFGAIPSKAGQLFKRCRVALNQMFVKQDPLSNELGMRDFETGELNAEPLKNQYCFA